MDKYLKICRLIKRRSVAQEACEQSRVKINNRIAKASSAVTLGDEIEIEFGQRSIKIKVTDISEIVSKSDATNMYELIQ